MTQSAAPITRRNSFGITALVLAVIGLVFCLLPLTGFIALILGLLAVLFGLLGWSRPPQGAGANRALPVLGTVLGIGTAAFGAWSAGTGFGASHELARSPQSVGPDPAVVSDVTVLGCSVQSEDGVPFAHATVKITNKTDRAQTYLMTINVNGASGARVGRVNAVSDSLGAGQSVTVSGVDASRTEVGGARPGLATCVLANVNRFPTAASCPPGEVDAKLC